MPRTQTANIDHNTVFLLLLSVRLVNALTLRTFFQPDEYYQALEPAWNFVPGHHGAWITWEWIQHLRSSLHPALFSLVYYVADIIAGCVAHSDLREGILLYAPKTAQAVIAASGDYYTWRLSEKIYGRSQLAFVTLWLTILNPWQWFCSTRTFSNGLESTLTIMALYYWPFNWHDRASAPKCTTLEATKNPETVKVQAPRSVASNLRFALVLAATATIMRPTNLLVWIVLASFALFGKFQQTAKEETKRNGTTIVVEDGFMSILLELGTESMLCGSIVLAASAGIDRAFYGTWTFPAINFLYFNVVQSLAVFYGNNDWHYYLSQGYPLLLTTALPFAVIGMYRIFASSAQLQHLTASSRQSLKQLTAISIVLPATLSILSHKEVRFIYPILGPLHVIATAPISDFFEPVLRLQQGLNQVTRPQTKPSRSILLALLIILNLLIAGYTSLIHNSGIIALPDYLRHEFTTHYYKPASSSSSSNTRNPDPAPTNMTLALLMPCHSTPWRSHLLNPPTLITPGIQAWTLTCEPPLHLTDPTSKKAYLDEADVFYADPARWLRKNMSLRPPSSTVPHPHRDPGLYAARNPRNKYLWTSSSNSHDSHSQTLPSTSGLDITDLLPSLRTAPGIPPGTNTNTNTEGVPNPRRPWPHYLAFFAHLEPTLYSALRGSGYVECWRTFNSHFHDDWRRTGDVVVWCLFPERAYGKTRTMMGGMKDADANVEVEEKKGEDERKEEYIVPEREGGQVVLGL